MIESISLSLILDGIILVLLMATIIYAARLSLYLRRFRDSKSDLESLITDLSKHITKADDALRSLNNAVEVSGKDLQSRMDRANQMYDELEMVVQSGDTMASRLEALAVKNRKILEGGHSDLEELERATSSKKGNDYDERLEGITRKVKEMDTSSSEPAPMFSIRDPEVERGETLDTSGFELQDDDVLSEAERDLYASLKKKKSKAGGRK